MALTPEELAGLPDSVVEMYEQLERTLIADISRRIKKAGEMTNSAEWQMIRLQELGMGADEVKKAIKKTTGMSQDEIDRIYKEAADKSVRFDSEIMTKMGLDPQANSGYLAQLLQAASSQTAGELGNFTQSMGFVFKDGRFSTIKETYQRSLDFTQYQVASGGVDYNTAVKNSVKELADSGIRIVDYSSGWRNHIEVAIRRAVVTGVSQITGEISKENASKLGTNYVEVTAHAGARPDHAVWQGKVYCLDGSTAEYSNLAEVTGYGKVTGLKGANCRHDFFPFIPGISQPAYTGEQLKHIDPDPITYEGRQYTYYEATQKQRHIETTIRQSKRRCNAYDAAGLPDEYIAESIRLRRLNELYKDFSDQAGLVTQRARTNAAGFSQTAAVKARTTGKAATKTAKKTVAKAQKPDIVKTEQVAPEVKTFTDLISQQPGLNSQHLDALVGRFKTGTEAAKAAFNKYVPVKSIADPAYKGGAHYSLSMRRINMNLANDLADQRGVGTTYFHEHGHLVDHYAGNGGTAISLAHPEFRGALEKDWRTYYNDYKKAHGMASTAEAYPAIASEVSTPFHNSISDLIGGLTGNKCIGMYGHKASYWKGSNKLEQEAFAHFFEAQFKADKAELLQKYFPTSMALFDKLLGGIV